MAAYLALGQFISTFAEPERSGFDIDENGMLVRCQKMKLNTTNTITNDRDSPLPPLEDPSLESDRLATRFDNLLIGKYFIENSINIIGYRIISILYKKIILRNDKHNM